MQNKKFNYRKTALKLAFLVCCWGAWQTTAFGQDKQVYKTGDRVECDVSGTGKFLPGTILPFDRYDAPDAADYYYHVRLDRYPDSDYKCSFKILRPLSANTNAAPPTATETPKNQTANQATANGKYKVGQRVECDSAGIGKYEKGTVVAFDQFDAPDAADFYYRVRLDSLMRSRSVCRLERMRPLGDTNGDVDPMANAAKLRVDADGTVFADRELLDCENLEQPKVRNGARPNAALMNKLIRCLYEKPASKGSDGAVTMDLMPLQIGAARKWILYQDLGSGGTLNTLVYPIKTTYTQRTFYRTRITERVVNAVFNCYVTTFGEWSCGQGESKQKGELKNIPVQE